MSVPLTYRLALQRSHLLWQFTRRDIVGRYRGSLLGLSWTIVSPLIMLAAFTLVFYGFFDLKWPVKATGSAKLDFSLQVFIGLLAFNWFAEVITRAPALIVNHPNLVTKVVFPLPILPWACVFAASFQALISLALLLILTTFLAGASVTWLALPLLVAPYLLLMAGLALWLAALGVYLRDLAPLTGLLTSIMMFLSPVFYPLSTVPEKWQAAYLCNPLALLVTQLRNLVFMHQWPEPVSLAWLYLAATMVLASGYWLFNRLRGGFADVL